MTDHRPEIHIVYDAKHELGEGPIYCEKSNSLYWVNILEGEIWKMDLSTESPERLCKSDEVIGGFTFQEDGSLLLFRVRDIAKLDPATGTITSLIPFHDEGMARFNDVIAAPDGSVFAGTIGEFAETGGLYHVSLNGTVTSLFKGTKIANGMGFSPDLKTFYWTCSSSRTIFAFDYNALSSTLGNRRELYKATPDEGIPDGLTLDSKGDLWSARWDGYGFCHITSKGELVQHYRLPAAQVSSLSFAGPKFDTLYATSAGASANLAEFDGAIFKITGLQTTGKPEFRSKILLDQ